MGRSKAKRPAPPPAAIPPVTEDDPNVQLAAQYEMDRTSRQQGGKQNRLISPTDRASSGNLLLSQTTNRQG